MTRQTSHNVHSTQVRKLKWPGLEAHAELVKWGKKPGWVSFCFDLPTLCFVRAEVGGRGELRLRADKPHEGEYHGHGHVTLLAPAQEVILYSESLREAEFWIFRLNPERAAVLSTEQAKSIRHTPTRLMFESERLRLCLELLCSCENDTGSYSLSLSQALLAALLDAVTNRTAPVSNPLTGPGLARVLAHIDSHLHESFTNDDLAILAGVQAQSFGHLFKQATGISPQRWQMDARVKRTQQVMIDDPASPLAEIAKDAGFSDQSHFTRAFLEVIGLTPTAWLHQRR